MFIELTDYHGNPARLEAERLLKLRPALQNLGDPDGCTLVDWGDGGIFAIGNIQTVAGLFAPHVRLAGLHAPDGSPVYVNADAIDAVIVDKAYAGTCVAVVAREFQNPRVPTRNRIALLETVKNARTILDAAAKDLHISGVAPKTAASAKNTVSAKTIGSAKTIVSAKNTVPPKTASQARAKSSKGSTS